MKKLKVLGTGCVSCRMLADLVEETAHQMGIEYTLTKVGKIDEITEFNVISTPALVVNGEVKVSGRIPSTDEIKDMIGE
jgi:small redox-active disulfide protein 2